MDCLKNIIQAYRFIVHNYQKNDEIFLFGFSRGAYTVRSLSGFIEKNWFDTKRPRFFLRFQGYKIYQNNVNKSSYEEFRKKHNCRKVRIKFIGVFDTVGALGIPIKWINNLLFKKYGFHDVELEENVENAFQALAIDERRKPFKPSIWKSARQGQNLQQAWFAGVHTNIGGGYNHDGLANCPLHWIKGCSQKAVDLSLMKNF